ncbi:hypothetical protein RHMOL_Rhmol13G0166000 [Rhododendron molle]|uniref:Uncharacterized protein n=1 Tax=Rhododendron molle TaxID=49168 RepID=A0ACC0L812_RHOML|nr:hypothetical protein RHMOL_Rhmol13G0166000 [Rhododendron molle]
MGTIAVGTSTFNPRTTLFHIDGVNRTAGSLVPPLPPPPPPLLTGMAGELLRLRTQVKALQERQGALAVSKSRSSINERVSKGHHSIVLDDDGPQRSEPHGHKEDSQGLLPNERCEVSNGGGTLTMVNTRTGEMTTYWVTHQERVSPSRNSKGNARVRKRHSPERSVEKTAATSFERGLDRNFDHSKELMLRASNDTSDLMRTIARYIELEDHIVGLGLVEVTDQSKPATKDAKKLVNTVTRKGGNDS